MVFPSIGAATNLVFWTTEVSPERKVVVDYLTNVFTLFHPDISIEVRGVDENTIAQALARALKTGRGPDIISCASDLVVSFDTMGWIDEALSKTLLEELGKDRFYSGALAKITKKNGIYCGIPFNGWVQGIWYRKDWFEDFRLEPPDTWSRILEAAKTLHAPEKGRYGILVGTREDVYAEQVFTHLALSAGVREFSSEGTVLFNSPATVETVKLYAELARYTPSGPQSWRARDFYLQGKLGMIFYSTFIMDDLAVPSVAADSLTGDHFEELDGGEYDYRLFRNTGMVSTLTGTQPASYGVLHALGIIHHSDKDKDMALKEFIHFLFTEEAYVTWLHMVPGGMLPVLKEIADAPAFYRDAQGVFQRYSRRRVNEIVTGFETLQSFSFIDGVLQPQASDVSAHKVIPRMLGKVLDKGISPRQAVSEAAAEMRDIAGGEDDIL